MFNAFTFFYKKKFTKVILFLNLTVLFISLNNLQAWLIDNNYYLDIVWYKHMLIPWYMLILPMFYAFLVHYLKVNDRLKSFIRLTLGIFILELIIRISLSAYIHNSKEDINSWIRVYNSSEEIFNAVLGCLFSFDRVILFSNKRIYSILFLILTTYAGYAFF